VVSSTGTGSVDELAIASMITLQLPACREPAAGPACASPAATSVVGASRIGAGLPRPDPRRS
jgi:hypothetical protein